MKTERDFKTLERQNNRLKRELAKLMKEAGTLALAIESLQYKADCIRANARAALNRAEGAEEEANP